MRTQIQLTLLVLLWLTTLENLHAQTRKSNRSDKKGKSEVVKTTAPEDLTSLQPLLAKLDTFNKAYPLEKLFIHTDKPYYSTGDTLWLKAYLFDSFNTTATVKSGLLYVELISDSLEVSKRIALPVTMGISWGQIALEPELFKEGKYTLRAYTNWMQNFGSEYFFSKSLDIGAANENQWLATAHHNLESNSGKTQLKFALQLNKMNGTPLNFTEIRWKLQDGKKTLAQKLVRSLDGSIEDRVELPEKHSDDLILVAQNVSNPDQKVTIPLKINKDDDFDLQFLPEGGQLVADLPSRLGFKAVGKDGLAISVSGTITDSQNNEITSFNTVHNGMGSIDFTPQLNDTYTANVRSNNGSRKKISLPPAKASGIALRLSHLPSSDSIKVDIFLSNDQLTGQLFRLAAFSRNSIYYEATFTATRQRVSSYISKKLFPTGVARFTLFNSENQPLNERILFINHQDNIMISLESKSSSYQLKDSIPLSFQFSAPSGKPAPATFSLAVTDDSQVKVDTLASNLLTQMLFESELTGHVEDPAYYLENSEKATAALDLLMLTQGWRGYSWEEVSKPLKSPAFYQEPGLMVKGRVLNILNKPVENSPVLLVGKAKSPIFLNAITNRNGEFEFTNLPPVDTASFFIQARNARGKSFNVGIQLDEFKPAPVSGSKKQLSSPWYLNSDSTLLQYLRNSAKARKEREGLLLREGRTLNEVVITAKKIIKTSKNLNGPGEADLVLDEEQIKKLSGNQPMSTGILALVPSLRISQRGDSATYMIENKEVKFIIDGIDLSRVYRPSDPPLLNEYYNYVSQNLNSLTDIIGIEVMRPGRFSSRYDMEYRTSQEILANKSLAYIEITTRGGKGILNSFTPGTAVYTPLPITWPKKFYQPKYTVNAKPSALSDFRATLHWEPNLISNAEGKAFTSFYAADKPGTYSLIIQGTDLNGLMGYKKFTLTIEDKK